MAKKASVPADVAEPSLNGVVPDDDALTVEEETGDTSTQIDALLDVADLYASVDDDTDAPIQITRVPYTLDVMRPRKSMWVTVCPDPEYTRVVVIYTDKTHSTGTDYFVKGKALQEEMCRRYGARKRRIYLAQDTEGTLFLWDIGLPSHDGSVNSWVQSAEQAIALAKGGFIHLVANMKRQEYDIDIGTSPLLPKVTWPEASMDDLMQRVRK